MDTAKLIQQDLIRLPEHIQKKHAWQLGLEFVVVETPEGLLLLPQFPYPNPPHPVVTVTLEQVAGSLAYDGPAKSIEEMDASVN